MNLAERAKLKRELATETGRKTASLEQNEVFFAEENKKLWLTDKGLYYSNGPMLYRLASHPYEPTTYIRGINNDMDITCHNAYDLICVVWAFREKSDMSPTEFIDWLDKQIEKHQQESR